MAATPMTGPEHYQAGENALEALSGRDASSQWYRNMVALAQAHFTAALTAAVALQHYNSYEGAPSMPNADRQAWRDAVGIKDDQRRPGMRVLRDE